MTMLENAKKVNKKRGKNNFASNPEFIELAVAWFNGEIGVTQAMKAVEGINNRNNLYTYFATAIKAAIEQGKVEIKLKK